MLSETQREFTDVIRIVWPDWEIIEKLGSGAFATVFRASRKEKIVGEKDSAIKIIRIPQEDTDWDQMLAEGKTAAQVRTYFQEAVDDALKEIRAMDELGGNTNIVNIYDCRVNSSRHSGTQFCTSLVTFCPLRCLTDSAEKNKIKKIQTFFHT